MAKLYFRHGTVGSAKTLNLLAVAHNYERQGKRVLVLKPSVDDRCGTQAIRSRAGLERQADVLVHDDGFVDLPDLSAISCILVDEAQFLPEAAIDALHVVAWRDKVPVICYGLRTDFRRQLFPGSRRLLELADAIEEVKTTCRYCEKKAVFNLKLGPDGATTDGPSVKLGFEETYQPVCSRCYTGELDAARRGEAPERRRSVPAGSDA